jgi:hypothetical protein
MNRGQRFSLVAGLVILGLYLLVQAAESYPSEARRFWVGCIASFTGAAYLAFGKGKTGE